MDELDLIGSEYDDELYELIDDIDSIDGAIDDVEDYEQDPEYDDEFLSAFDIVGRDESALEMDSPNISSRYVNIGEGTTSKDDNRYGVIKSPSSMKKFMQFMGVMKHDK